MSRSHRKKIALDLVGILEDSWSHKKEWFKGKGIDLGPSELSREQILALPGVTDKLYWKMAKAVYSDEGILSHPPVNGARLGLQEVSKIFRPILLTLRGRSQESVTASWLEQNGLLQFFDPADLVLIGDPLRKLDGGTEPVSKMDWCTEHLVHCLVDDSLAHLEATKSPGSAEMTKRVLFGTSGEGMELPDHVAAVEDWSKLTEFLEKESNIES